MAEEKYSYMFGDTDQLGADDTSLPVVAPESVETGALPPPAPVSHVTPPDNAGSHSPSNEEKEVSRTAEISAVLDTPPPRWKRVGRGVYLKLLLQLRTWTDEQLVAAVHAYYPNSRTTAADVKFNASLIGRQIGAKPAELRPKTEKVELLPPPPWEPVLERHFETVLNDEGLKELLNYVHESEGIAGGQGTVPAPETASVAPVAAPKYADEKQPSRFRKSVDPNRQFDKTSLRQGGHMQWVARDTLAHLCRWAFAGRFINGTTEVLDVGCGPDVQMINILTMPRNNVPLRYVGCDLNRQPQKCPSRQWATLHWAFNFIERYQELGQFDLVVNLEMIEHLHGEDQPLLLAGLKACLKPNGLILLSTPVYNGHAAAVHLKELRVDELAKLIEDAGLKVRDRFGTFASAPSIKKVATEPELQLISELSRYYSAEFISIILAPKYPDASRNNLWALEHA